MTGVHKQPDGAALCSSLISRQCEGLSEHSAAVIQPRSIAAGHPNTASGWSLNDSVGLHSGDVVKEVMSGNKQWLLHFSLSDVLCSPGGKGFPQQPAQHERWSEAVPPTQWTSIIEQNDNWTLHAVIIRCLEDLIIHFILLGCVMKPFTPWQIR